MLRLEKMKTEEEEEECAIKNVMLTPFPPKFLPSRIERFLLPLFSTA